MYIYISLYIYIWIYIYSNREEWPMVTCPLRAHVVLYRMMALFSSLTWTRCVNWLIHCQYMFGICMWVFLANLFKISWSVRSIEWRIIFLYHIKIYIDSACWYILPPKYFSLFIFIFIFEIDFMLTWVACEITTRHHITQFANVIIPQEVYFHKQ